MNSSNNQFSNAKSRPDIIFMFIFTTLVPLIGIPLYAMTIGFDATTIITALVLFAFSNLSITVGYHRLWSHKTYVAKNPVKWILAIGGALSLQNSVLKWASDHRRHHRFVDDNEKDPYSANRGFWFSHIGWMLKDYPSAKEDYSNVKDLQKDPVLRWQHRYYLPAALITNLGIPLAIGAIHGNPGGMLLLAGFARLVASHHSTFFINSLAHIWGSRPHSTKNTARDNPFLAIITFGEGYHNFHHAFPGDYRNGTRWYHYDPTKWTIWLLSKVGLTTGLRRTPKTALYRAAEQTDKPAAQSKAA